MKAIVIGGGIMGLSSAHYLQKCGWNVTVIDKHNFQDNASYGNAGYVCPSHFIPLASPGIVQQGLKLMWNPRSAFYVEPRLSWSLISWGMKFMKVATKEHLEKSAVPLRDIALFSQHCYTELGKLPGFEMAYEHKGLLEYYQTAEKEEHSHHIAEDARKLGLEAEMLTREQVQAMEPEVHLNIKGALYFKCDAHLYPQKLMQSMKALLQQNNVRMIGGEELTGFEMQNGKVQKVKTNKKIYDTDLVVMATGAWSREVAKMVGHDLLLMPGRGYSVTLENSPFQLNYPAVLQEGRVAITPMDGNKIRFGGTMEITSTNKPPRMNRVIGILEAVQQFLPDFKFPLPQEKDVWYGYRPCSADGLPYIGKVKENVIVATGHAMVGLSLGAGTGKLVSEIASGEKTSVDVKPYDPSRFS